MKRLLLVWLLMVASVGIWVTDGFAFARVAGASDGCMVTSYTDSNNWSATCVGVPTGLVGLATFHDGSTGGIDVLDTSTITPGAVTFGVSGGTSVNGGSFDGNYADLSAVSSGLGTAVTSVSDWLAQTNSGIFVNSFGPSTPTISGTFGSVQSQAIDWMGILVGLIVSLLLLALGIRLLVKWSKSAIGGASWSDRNG